MGGMILLAALTFPQGHCAEWATLVERIEAMPVEQRTWARWLHEAEPITKRYVLSARNWLAAGKGGEQAWRECGSV